MNSIAIVFALIVVVVIVVIFTTIPDRPGEKYQGAPSPTTGYELSYDPEWWLNFPNSKQHNCYDYALGNVSYEQKSSTQPSYPQNTSIYSCDAVELGILTDNKDRIRKATFEEPCLPHEYKIAMMVAPGITPLRLRSDYHFMRQNADGTWSHKSGQDMPTDTDGSGNRIIAPHESDRDFGSFNYSDMCGYYCLKPSL